MPQFFIDRPIFAWVIALLIMLAGVLAIATLPVEQYPRIAPPGVTISAFYPGASAQTVEATVTQIIEEKMKGLDHLRYMSSTSDAQGNAQITLTFNTEADPDIAQVQVQNKLQTAMPLLPAQVQQQGVQVSKSSHNFLMVAALVSEDGKYSAAELSNYIATNLENEISRVSGVGEVMVFGTQHAMRIWLNPDKLVSFGLSVADVANAVRVQNVDVSAGQIGGLPSVDGQMINATILAQSRMQKPEEFENILLRVQQDGAQVRLGDVARVEIGSEDYSTTARYNGNPASGLAVRLASGANALSTADAVRERMAELEQYLPEGVSIVYPYDTTPFVRISIQEVVKTLAEAFVLVFLVMFLFLQNLRATFIPTIAVPVVLLGTFAVLALAGFSINTLTMFAIVMAIGLLVDDAIVVIENVERIMAEEGLSPKEAARKSMRQITGALVAISLVLSIVFIPMAFFSGSTGAIYRQFSLTLVAAIMLSAFVALSLTPALCATMLKPVDPAHKEADRGFFGWFNRFFNRSRSGYVKGVAAVTRRPLRMVFVFALMVGLLGWMFMRLPTSFLPDEDQGILMVQISTPADATQQRTLEAIKAVETYFQTQEKENIDGILTVAGFSFAGRGQNMAFGFISLKDWNQRKRPDQGAHAIANRAMMQLSILKDAQVYALVPPAIVELGMASGFDVQLVDRAGLGHDALLQARNMMLGMAMQNPAIAMVRPNGLEDKPQFKIEVDREKASALGLSLADINQTLSVACGSSYVNDYIENGRVKKVFVQADAPYRMMPEDLQRWYVRNDKGEMVPFSSFATTHWTYGSPQLERYNGQSSRNIMGVPAPGVSSGAVMAIMEQLGKNLPHGIGLEWTGMSYEERLAGAQAPMLYALSIFVVFLCLAALYESWSIPVAVLFVVPIGALGAVLAVMMRDLPNDIYFKVGLLTTIGLASRNAILIVEFAKTLHEEGHSLMKATLMAAKQRFRPILMTSFAFILGVMPLALADGAGSGAQNAIGTGVMGGMLSATLLAIFFIPVFFILVLRLVKWQPQRSQQPSVE